MMFPSRFPTPPGAWYLLESFPFKVVSMSSFPGVPRLSETRLGRREGGGLTFRALALLGTVLGPILPWGHPWKGTKQAKRESQQVLLCLCPVH